MHDDYLDPERSGMFDEKIDNSVIDEAFPDHDGLYSLYRAIYKWTDCGASLHALISYTLEPTDPEGYENEMSGWFTNDDLKQWGSFKDMDKDGHIVIALTVDSIVEGSEASTESFTVYASGLDVEPADLAIQFWTALDVVEEQADQLWKEANIPDEFAGN